MSGPKLAKPAEDARAKPQLIVPISAIKLANRAHSIPHNERRITLNHRLDAALAIKNTIKTHQQSKKSLKTPSRILSHLAKKGNTCHKSRPTPLRVCP
jgi:hypothetical protein